MKQYTRRRFFAALAAAPLALLTHEEGAPSAENEDQLITRHAIAYHTEKLMEHENRIGRVEGLVKETGHGTPNGGAI